MTTPFAITLDVGTSRANKTGSWRTFRPEYVERKPPCNNACPAGEDTQRWLSHVQSGDYETAWRALTRDNPLPATMGRVCYHPCERACNRAQLDAEVGIHCVERFLGDEALRQGWRFSPPERESGKRVLIVGAGPAGLSAACQLRRCGHRVTVVDDSPRAGGMMRYGIPSYRLPRTVLDAEIARIVALGVELKLNQRIDDLESTMRDGGYDAAFLALGAHRARTIALPTAAGAHGVSAIDLLRQIEQNEAPALGRRVVVYGGGNTAFDVARSVRRLGATDVSVVYHRSRDTLPAHDFEVEEALEEGITLRLLTAITAVDGATTLTLERQTLDEAGRPQPGGEREQWQADTLVLALGQQTDLSCLDGVSGLDRDGALARVDATMMTGRPGVFAGGDMVPSERTVTVAIGHGKKAARHIDAWLAGRHWHKAAEHDAAGFDALNLAYYPMARRTSAPQRGLDERVASFAEVRGGLPESEARREANRCLSCGNCFECDTCYSVCPDNAVIKLGAGERFRIDYDYCKGCGICAEECPCGAIAMLAESI